MTDNKKAAPGANRAASDTTFVDTNNSKHVVSDQCAEALELKRNYLAYLLNQFGGNSVENQRQRIVESLARFSLTTPEIRRHLDVMEVAARIWELRHVCGHVIDKTMVEDRTDLGRKHKVALYVLTRYVGRAGFVEGN